MYTKERIAYHEAGHAVAAYEAGRKFKLVTIKQKGSSLGHLAPWGMNRRQRDAAEFNCEVAAEAVKEGVIFYNRFRLSLEKTAIIFAAGALTEQALIDGGIIADDEPGLIEELNKQYGDNAVPENLNIYTKRLLIGRDWEYMSDLLEGVSGSKAEAIGYQSWLIERTWTLVNDITFLAAVTALAGVLLEKETLSGKEARAIIADAIRKKTEERADDIQKEG